MFLLVSKHGFVEFDTYEQAFRAAGGTIWKYAIVGYFKTTAYSEYVFWDFKVSHESLMHYHATTNVDF